MEGGREGGSRLNVDLGGQPRRWCGMHSSAKLPTLPVASSALLSLCVPVADGPGRAAAPVPTSAQHRQLPGLSGAQVSEGGSGLWEARDDGTP